MISKVSVVSNGFLASLLLLAVAGWVSAWLLRRRRVLARAVILPLATLLSLCLVADLVNRYYNYLPRLGDVTSTAFGVGGAYPVLSDADLAPTHAAQTARHFPHGGVWQLHVPDRGSGFGASAAPVYLPPQYFSHPTWQFPAVYLIHGSPGVPDDWLRGGEAADAGADLAASGHPIVIVIPRMSHGWLDDPECLNGKTIHVETHLLRDVIPTAQAVLRLQPDRPARAIAGMSAGGYCALNLGLRHRAVFGTIIDMSGLTRPARDGGLGPLLGSGPQAQAALRANSPDLYLDALPRGEHPRVWLDVGAADHAVLPELIRMQSLLAAHGYPVQLTVRPGSHTFTVWRPALRDDLRWFAASAPHAGPPATTPTYR